MTYAYVLTVESDELDGDPLVFVHSSYLGAFHHARNQLGFRAPESKRLAYQQPGEFTGRTTPHGDVWLGWWNEDGDLELSLAHAVISQQDVLA